MAKLSNLATRIWFDEFDFSGELNSSEQEVLPEIIKTNTFSDTGPRAIEGNYDHRHTDIGFFDASTDFMDEELFASLNEGADHFLTKLWGDNAEGSPAYDFVVRVNSQPLSGKIGDAVLRQFSCMGSAGCARGVILANVTTTGAENRTCRNMGATAAGKLFAVIFRVFTFDGTDITLKIQESTDDAAADAYADITGLTSGALTAKGVVRATTVAATEAWKRCVVSGTFTSAVIGVTAGVVAGT